MEQEFEKPELQPEPALSPDGRVMPGRGERVPMPAGPGSPRRAGAEKSFNGFGLVAAAILTAGLAGAIVFRGDIRNAAPPSAAQPPAVQVVVTEPSKAPPVALAPAPVAPIQLPSELSSLGAPGSPVETIAQTPHSLSSPMPFFSSDEAEVIPKTSALQPYENSRKPAQQPASARPVLPAADQLTPRLQPRGIRPVWTPRANAGLAALPAAGPCTINCAGAASGSKTNAALQGGESFVQHEVSTVFMGLCEGKYIYEYSNLTVNKTIGMKVVTSGGEAWTFTLKPGDKTSIKSSTEFVGNSFENYRISEVMN